MASPSTIVRCILAILLHFWNTQAAFAPCCGPACPIDSCDIQGPSTDLSGYYPAPSFQSGPPPNTTLPCCGFYCVDGGCRIPTRARPSQTPRFTKTLPVGKGRLVDVVRCLEGNRDCNQGVAFKTREPPPKRGPNVFQAAQPTLYAGQEILLQDDMAAQITPIATHQPIHPFDDQGDPWDDHCLGCAGSPCNACGFIALPFLEFTAHPDKTAPRDETVALKTAKGPTSTTSAGLAHKSSPSPTNHPESILHPSSGSADAGYTTYILPDKVVFALAGKSQNELAVMIENAKPKPIGVVAQIDLKLSQNYITRRALNSLGLLGATTPFPKGAKPSPVILNRATLDLVSVNETIVLELTFKSLRIDRTTGKPNRDLGYTYTTYTGVRFQVYGTLERELFDTQVSEITFGSILMREVQVLGIAPTYHVPVRDGDLIVEPIVQARLWTDEDSGVKRCGDEYDAKL